MNSNFAVASDECVSLPSISLRLPGHAPAVLAVLKLSAAAGVCPVLPENLKAESALDLLALPQRSLSCELALWSLLCLLRNRMVCGTSPRTRLRQAFVSGAQTQFMTQASMVQGSSWSLPAKAAE